MTGIDTSTSTRSGALLLDHEQRRLSVGGRDHAIPAALQDDADQEPDVFVVVDDQDERQLRHFEIYRPISPPA